MRSQSVRRGSSEDLEEVYREQSPRLYRSLLLFTGDGEVSADAVAEAFAQLIRRGSDVRAPDRWVWKAAFNIAAGELQTRRREAAVPLPEVAYEIQGTPVELSLAMAQLSPMQRAAVALHDFAGYPLRETAAISGSTPSAVSVHLVRAHRRLRKLLEVRDEE